MFRFLGPKLTAIPKGRLLEENDVVADSFHSERVIDFSLTFGSLFDFRIST